MQRTFGLNKYKILYSHFVYLPLKQIKFVGLIKMVTTFIDTNIS